MSETLRALCSSTIAPREAPRGSLWSLLGLLVFAAACAKPANADSSERPRVEPSASVAAINPSPSTSSPEVPSKPPVPVEERFLVIGDSYVFGKLGSTLDAMLRRSPNRRVWTYGSCGSSPLTWIIGIPTPCGIFEHEDGGASKTIVQEASLTPQIKKLLAKVQPDVTVIMMGVNFLHCPNTTAPDVKKLVDLVENAGSRCVWVGPPLVIAKAATPVEREETRNRYERLYQALSTEKRCKLIDTRKLGVPVEDKTDGYHAGPLTTAKLGVEVAKILTGTQEE